ncbi:hypothetical protein HPB52_004366 [Rhipicephalus sanguineus]|uniref:Uncharacterized protein n=1 Tax=Rhipicephalus sanguineus TaxID=34632 RepID=A0A9D4QHP4_RHISA|nr:hypothetical protein HPB52_004366 [Rhipicephalus sanguineus]
MNAQCKGSTPIWSAPRPSDAQKGAEPALQEDASDTEWPSLPYGGIRMTTSWATTPKVAEKNRQNFYKTPTTLKNLLKSLRAILCELQKPGAKAAVHILNVLEPLLGSASMKTRGRDMTDFVLNRGLMTFNNGSPTFLRGTSYSSCLDVSFVTGNLLSTTSWLTHNTSTCVQPVAAQKGSTGGRDLSTSLQAQRYLLRHLDKLDRQWWRTFCSSLDPRKPLSRKWQAVRSLRLRHVLHTEIAVILCLTTTL